MEAPGIETFVMLFWGVFVALFQEQFGKFQDLSPKAKQLVTAASAYVIPAIAIWFVNPWWQADWGSSEGFVTAIVIFLAPAFVWAASQLTHLIDATGSRIRQYVKDDVK